MANTHEIAHDPHQVALNVRAILGDGGLHSTLQYLNGRTRHRFTGVYRFDAPTLRSVALFDRENPDLLIGGDAPMRETYCAIVGETERAFVTSDTMTDERVVDHPARASVMSYCGVLLRDSDGHAFGSMCHFDLRPRVSHESETAVLEAVAPLIMAAIQAAAQGDHGAYL